VSERREHVAQGPGPVIGCRAGSCLHHRGALYIEIQKPRLARTAEVAAARGDWSGAARAYLALTRLDSSEAARARRDEAVRHAVDALAGGKDLLAEVELLRWLDAIGDRAALAEMLDRSVVAVPAGYFIMGSDTDREDERPQHLVYLDLFEIDRYEVTNAHTGVT